MMKNKFTLLMTFLLILAIGFGCNQFIPGSGGNDKSGTTKDGTNLNETAKTGVAECDEFIDMLNNDSKSPDEDFVSRKIREYAVDFAKESIKKNIEENKNDKEKIAKGCKEAKEKYLKDKAEKNNNKNASK